MTHHMFPILIAATKFDGRSDESRKCEPHSVTASLKVPSCGLEKLSVTMSETKGGERFH